MTWAGTASVFACAVGGYQPDVKYKTILFAPGVIEGLYTPMAYISGGGMCLKWFRDAIFEGEKKATGNWMPWRRRCQEAAQD